MEKELTWYLNRLSCMSFNEILYRVKTKVFTSIEKRKRVSEIHLSPDAQDKIKLLYLTHLSTSKIPDDTPNILRVANKAFESKLDIFSIEYEFDGVPLWNMDPKTKIISPMVYGKTLNYRDENIVGDIKYLWEPSRHLHFPNLAFAYRSTNDPKYLECLFAHIRSWIDQCPHLKGPHWISSLELGIRLINWALTWSILGEQLNDLFNLPNGAKLKEDWLKSIKQHVQFIDGHYSRYSSANNHLIGEASGIFIAAMLWPLDKEIIQSGERAKKILEQESTSQNYADGVNKEQAISYQQFVLDFLLLPYLIGKSYGNHFSANYINNIENMMSYLASIMDVNGNIPMIGDADDGYAFRFEGNHNHCPYKSLLATGAVLFGRDDFKTKSEQFDSRSWLLLGNEGLESYKSLGSSDENVAISIRTTFPDGGYYIIGDNFGCKNEYRMVMDAGPLGYGGIAAHGHADSLALYLTIYGNEFLIDPGTYAYHTEKKWRDYFKGTSAHNTLRVDGKDQSLSGGNFMWIRKAKSTLLKWEELENTVEISAKHTGYESNKKPVSHQRNVFLNKKNFEYTITDKVKCKGSHLIEQFWHFHENCEIKEITRNHFLISNKQQKMTISFDNDIEIEIEKGNDAIPLGWVSRAFDSKLPAYTLVGRVKINSSRDLKTHIILENTLQTGKRER